MHNPETTEQPDAQQAVSGIGTVSVTIVDSKPSDRRTLDVLAKADTAKLEGVILLGYDAEGREYIDTNIDDGGDAVWLLQRAIHRLVSHDGPK